MNLKQQVVNLKYAKKLKKLGVKQKSLFYWTKAFYADGFNLSWGLEYKEMKKWLKDKRIVNEYKEDVSNKEFWAMIKTKKNGLSHYDYVKNKHSEFFSEHELLIDGYSFINTEFS